VRCATLLLLAIACLGLAPGAVADGFDAAGYTRLLQRFTRDVDDAAGVRVDYRGLAGSDEWRRLIANLAANEPEALATRPERLAFWINAYNILAIDLVVRHQPLDDIRDIGSFLRPVWKREAGLVGGRSISLDRIEHGLLRPLGDPRIHAAVVCASTSCPSLLREAWSAAALDAQFDAARRRWLEDPRKGARADTAAHTLYLSRIFDWFADDFAASGGVLAFVAPYLGAEDRAWLARNPDPRIRFLDYDWSLNGLGDR
jgi:hypothetical protein